MPAKKPKTPKTPKASTTTKAPKASTSQKPAALLIDQRIRELGDWRGETLARMRAQILAAEPAMVEEVKWVKPTNPWGVPVWSHEGIVCTGEVYKDYVKLTFAHGASLPDPAGLFNASLEGHTRRAIDIHEGDKVDMRALKALVKAAVAHNGGKAGARTAQKASAKASAKTAAKKPSAKAKPASAEKKVVLLSGGNPQIPKGEGDAPVQAYIAAMPGWKRDLGRELDALIVRTVPDVRKAVKWNSPFYGVEGKGWFLSYHVFTRFVKVTFFQGKALKPMPPGGTPKSGDTRWVDVHEGQLDEKQMAAWVKQAAAIPGWDV